MWPTSASDWCSVSARSHCATGTTGSLGARPRSSLDARVHADLPHKQLRSLLCAQLSAVQAAADPDASSPGSLSDTLHRRSTGIREGSLGILCFGRRLTVLHQVQVHVGHLRWFHHHPADA
jgi:hypothetical protein